MSASELLNLRRFSQRLRDCNDCGGGLDEDMISDTIENIRHFPANEATTRMQKSLSKQLHQHRETKHRATKISIIDESLTTSVRALQQTAADVVDNTASNNSRPRKFEVVQQDPGRKQPTAKRSSVFDDTSSAAKIHSLMLDQKVRPSNFVLRLSSLQLLFLGQERKSIPTS